MARGWESKSIEEQMESASEERNAAKGAKGLIKDCEILQEREGLLLQITHTHQQLSAARNPRYRALLTETLRQLDDRLQLLETIFVSSDK
jgi:biopolymer transport protein ExbB/TolQ